MATPIKQIAVGGTNYNIRGYFYGTCDTAIDVGAKVVVCPEFSADDLVDSTLLVINFAEELDTDESGAITLNVNSTGAKSLKCFKNTILNTLFYFSAITPALCIYSTAQDCWMLIGPSPDLDTINSYPTVDRIQGQTINRYAACSTGASTAAKTASAASGTVTLSAGLAVYVKFANANTASTPTLNINSKGAKNIFYNGAQITTGDEKSLLKGTCLFIYDGTQWHLIPSSSNSGTDTKVEQKAAITTNGAYPIILAETTATTATTSYVNKSSNLKYNPSTKALTTGGTVDGINVATHTHSLTTSSTNTGSKALSPTTTVSGTTSTSGTFTILTITASTSVPDHNHTYVQATAVGTPQ